MSVNKLIEVLANFSVQDREKDKIRKFHLDSMNKAAKIINNHFKNNDYSPSLGVSKDKKHTLKNHPLYETYLHHKNNYEKLGGKLKAK